LFRVVLVFILVVFSCCPSLTALPVGMAELEVPAGARRVLLGALRAADVLDLVVEGFERGVHLGVVLPQVTGRLVGPHVPHGVVGLLRPVEAGEGRHVDAGTGGTGRAGGTGVSGGSLKRERERERR